MQDFHELQDLQDSPLRVTTAAATAVATTTATTATTTTVNGIHPMDSNLSLSSTKPGSLFHGYSSSVSTMAPNPTTVTSSLGMNMRGGAGGEGRLSGSPLREKSETNRLSSSPLMDMNFGMIMMNDDNDE